jgi:hypothetical protein
MAQPYAIPFFHDPEINTEQGARDYPVTFNFAASSIYDNCNELADVGLFTLQMVYIDNGQNPAPLSLMLRGTRQVITMRPFTQGYRRVLGSPRMLDYTVTSFGGGSAVIHFLNIVPDGSDSWETASEDAVQGSGWAVSQTGANAPIVLNAPNVAGRQTLITSITASLGGATAAALAAMTLTNMNNNGVAQTLTTVLGTPAGAAIAAAPFFRSYYPAIPVLMGSVAVLTLPALGVGNLQASLEMTGLIV